MDYDQAKWHSDTALSSHVEMPWYESDDTPENPQEQPLRSVLKAALMDHVFDYVYMILHVSQYKPAYNRLPRVATSASSRPGKAASTFEHTQQVYRGY